MSFKFVAVWPNQSGSASALCQEHALNPLALSTGKSSVRRSCIHTFSMDMVEKFLKVSPETVQAATKDAPLQLNVDAEEAFGMKLRIVVLEAAGQEEALKKKILNRNSRTGEVMGITANLKRSSDTKEPVMVDGLPVYRKTKLVSADSSEQDDMLPVVVAPAVVPTTPPVSLEDNEEGVGELF
jgi:hypothetical protein